MSVVAEAVAETTTYQTLVIHDELMQEYQASNSPLNFVAWLKLQLKTARYERDKAVRELCIETELCRSSMLSK